MFGNFILLPCIPACKLSLNSLIMQKFAEFFGEVFSPSIKPQATYILAYLFLNHSLKSLKLIKHFTFLFHKINPQFPCVVINKHYMIPVSPHRCGI